MTCQRCGSGIAEGQLCCPDCNAPVRKPGLLERLFGWLSGPLQVTLNVNRTTEIRQERFETVDEMEKRQVYHSLNEVPPEFRSKIEEAMRGEQRDTQTSKGFKITVKDSSGKEQTYDSVGEMPADLRAIYERVQRHHRS